jgi:hypothetical protein
VVCAGTVGDGVSASLPFDFAKPSKRVRGATQEAVERGVEREHLRGGKCQEGRSLASVRGRFLEGATLRSRTERQRRFRNGTEG